MNEETSRRRLLGMGVAAAATVGGVAAVATAAPAAAADGDPLLLGQENEANNTAVIKMLSAQAAIHAISPADDGALVGENTASDGYGLRGTAPYIGVVAVGGETGVYSVSDKGVGVKALTYDGVAVHASTAVDAGLALDVVGAVRLSRSGVAVIPAGTRSLTVAAGVRATSNVLATLQTRQPGCALEAVVPAPTTRSFTIYLSQNARSPLRVAWMLLD
jgi:hypothetical protein